MDTITIQKARSARRPLSSKEEQIIKYIMWEHENDLDEYGIIGLHYLASGVWINSRKEIPEDELDLFSLFVNLYDLLANFTSLTLESDSIDIKFIKEDPYAFDCMVRIAV